MRLEEQWRQILAGLPEGWVEARLLVRLEAGDYERAAGLLGPAAPGRTGAGIRLVAARRPPGAGPELVGRLMRRLDRARVAATLELVDVTETGPREEAVAPAHSSLAAEWDAALAGLPADWSDLHGELRLDSGGHLERAALLMSPLNPTRSDAHRLRFRSARRFGYGTSPEMTRRCLERLDSERITGGVEILRALSETDHVATQGPVWYVGGRAV